MAASSFVLTFDETWLTTNNYQVSPPIGGITGLVEVDAGGGPAAWDPESPILTITNGSAIQIVGEFTSFGNGADSWLGAAGLTGITIDNSASMISITNLSGAFNGCVLFTDTAGSGLDQLDVTNVTDMSHMFTGCSIFNNTGLGNWERTTPHTSTVGNVIAMNGMFAFCGSFKGDSIDAWNVSAVTDFTVMFHTAVVFNNTALGSWTLKPNVSGLGEINMSQMFYTAIDFSGNSIETWNMGNTVNTSSMFYNAYKFNNTSLGSWEANGSTMFHVTSMQSMFFQAPVFEGGDIDLWNISMCTDFSRMFEGATSFNNTNLGNWERAGPGGGPGPGAQSTLNFAGINSEPPNVNLYSMFKGATSFQGTSIESWNVTSVTQMSRMFEGATVFNTNLAGWERAIVNDTSTVAQVTDMSHMFESATAMYTEGSLNVDLTGWVVGDIAKTNFLSVNGSSDITTSDPNSPFSPSTVLIFDAPCDVTLPISGFTSIRVTWNYPGEYATFTEGPITGQTGGVIMIRGDFTTFGTGSTTWQGAEHLTEVAAWSSVTSLSGACNGCGILTTVAVIPSTVNNLSYMFMNASGFTGGNIDLWNVTNVTDMSHMFEGATGFNNTNLGDWMTNGSTSSVNNMSYMFKGATSFAGPSINLWATGSVADMSHMFEGATDFNNAGLSTWVTSSVNNMSYMFKDATSFSGDTIDSWNVVAVTDMSHMFEGATGFNNTALQAWNTSPSSTTLVNNMSYMFKGATSFAGTNIDLWDVSGVTDMSHMFEGATGFNNTALGNWMTNGSTSSVNNMSYMFKDATSFVGTSIKDWNVTGVTDMSHMFEGATGFNPIDLGSWEREDSTTATIADMSYMFKGATSFIGTTIDQWAVTGVADMRNMFEGATDFNNTDLGNWEREFSTTASVGNMSYMFKDATSFSGVTIDLWNVTGVTDMSHMFEGATDFNPTDLGGWERTGSTTASVGNMSYMFKGTTAYPGSGLGVWLVSGVTDMSHMFEGSTFNSTGLGGWDVSTVNTMASMFKDNTSFTDVSIFSIDNWIVAQVSDMSNMFDGTVGLYNDSGNGWLLTDEIFWTVTPGTINTRFLYLYGNETTTSDPYSPFYIESSLPAAMTLNFDPLSVTEVTLPISGIDANGIYVNFGDGVYQHFDGSAPITGTVTGPVDVSGVFSTFGLGSISWQGVGSLINVSGTPTGLTNLSGAFNGAPNFNGSSIHNWDVSLVTDMSFMFKDAGTFNNENLGQWDVSEVLTMSHMFEGAVAFAGTSIESWNVSKVADMSHMFFGATFFTNLQLTNWERSSPDTSSLISVQDVSYMFYHADGLYTNGLFNMNLRSAWTLTAASRTSFFHPTGDEDTTTLDPHSPFFAPPVALTLTFTPDTAVTLPISGIDANGIYVNFGDGNYVFHTNESGPITGTVTGEVTVSGVFTGFGLGADPWTGVAELLDVTGTPTGLTNLFGAFNGAAKFTGTTIHTWDVSLVTDMAYMFKSAEAFNNQNLGNWEREGSTTALVQNMGFMFTNAITFLGTGIESWNVSDVNNMLAMFAYCPVNTDLSGWEREGSSLSSVTVMEQMFLQSGMYTDGALTYDLRGWNVSAVEFKSQFLSTDGINDLTFDDQNSPFFGLNPHVLPIPFSLTFTPDTTVTLPITGIDSNGLLVDWGDGNGYTSYPQGSIDITGTTTTGHVDISGVFTGFGNGIQSWTGAAELIDISGTPGGMTNLAGAFNGASKFVGTYLNIFDTAAVTDMSYMFAGASVFNNTLNWDVSLVTSMAGMFLHASSFTGANIELWNVSLVQDMTNMFNSSGLANLLLANWERTDPSVSTLATVSSMAGMFANASAMYTGSFQADLTNWNVTSVTNRNLFLSPSSFSEDTSTSDQNSPFYSGSQNILPFRMSFATNPFIDTDWTNPAVYPAGSVLNATLIGQGGAGSTGEAKGGSGAGIEFMYTFTSDAPAGSVVIHVGTTGGVFDNDTGIGTDGDFSSITFIDNETTYMVKASGGTASSAGEGSGIEGIGGSVLFFQNDAPVSSIPGLSVILSGSGTNGSVPPENGYKVAGGTDTNLWVYGSGGGLSANGYAGFVSLNLSIHVTLPIDGIDAGGLMVNFGADQQVFNQGSIVSGLATGDVSIFGNFTTFGTGTTRWQGVDSVNSFLNWGSAPLTNVSGAFNGASQLNAVYFPYTLPSSITDVSYMFNDASGLYSNRLVQADFEGWDVTSVGSNYAFFLSPDGIEDTSETDSASPFYVTPLPDSIPHAMTLTFTPGTEVTLPISGIDTSGITVDWGDGTYIPYPQGSTEIAGITGTGLVDVSGVFSTFGLGSSPWQGVAELLDVTGTPTGLTDLSGAFNGAVKFTGTTSSVGDWNVSQVTDMSYMFKDAEIFETMNLGNWERVGSTVANVGNMSRMFNHANAFTGVGIESWNVSGVTDMSYMFCLATVFNNTDLSGWERTESTLIQVQNMKAMFDHADAFTGSSIESWNVSGVTDMSFMFNHATVFNNQLLGNWQYGRPALIVTDMTSMFANSAFDGLGQYSIDLWSVSTVTSFDSMFDGATAFNNPNLGYWERTPQFFGSIPASSLSGAKSMSAMFRNAQNFMGVAVTDFAGLGNNAGSSTSINVWNVSGVTTMSNMFNGSGLMDISGAGIDQWNVTGVTDMSYMLANLQGGCTNTGLGNWERDGSTVANVQSMAHMFDTTGFVDVPGTGVDKWNVSGVTDFSYMFANSGGFNNTNLGNWILSPNAQITMAHMFNQTSFVDVIGTGVDQWNVTSVTDMSYMFANTNFANQGLGNWESETSTVANVKTFQGMFSTSNPGYQMGPTGLTGIDSWVIGATDMSSMFKNNSNFLGSTATPPILLVQWESNTNGIVTSTMAAVTTVAHMFDSCALMTDAGATQGLDMWNLSSVSDMSYMFKDCAYFDNDNLGNWTVSQVKDMSYMFAGSGLTDAGQNGVNLWNVTEVTDMSHMFSGAISFANPNLGNWERVGSTVASVQSMAHMFEGATLFPGTGLEGWNVSGVTNFDSMFNMASGGAFYDENNGNAKIDLTGWNVVNYPGVPTSFFNTDTFGEVTTTDPRSPFWAPTTSPMTLTFLITQSTPEITLPISGITGDIHVNWGNGLKGLNLLTGTPTGTVSIWGQFTSFSHYDPTYTGWLGVGFLIGIGGWDNPGITDLSGACMGSHNLENVPTYLPPLVTNLSYLFAGCDTYLGAGIEVWDVTNITDMSYMFANATQFNNTQLGTVAWNTQYVKNMAHMFDGAGTFEGTSVEQFNVSEVTDMSFMFANTSLRNETLGTLWDTSKVKNMAGMFQGIYDFSGNTLENFNVSEVTDMSYMFTLTSTFNNTHLDQWTTSKVQNMSNMFSDAVQFTGANIDAWDVSGVTDMSFMFANTNLFNNTNLGQWDTRNVKSMAHMFEATSNFFGTSIHLWDVSGVTNMTSMFRTAPVFDNSGLNIWVTSQVTDMSNMFYEAVAMYDAGNFKYDLTGWDVANVGTNYTNFMFTTEDTSTIDPYSPFFIRTYVPIMTLIFSLETPVELPISGIDSSGLQINWNDGNGYVFYNQNETAFNGLTSRVDIAGNFTTFGLGASQWTGVTSLISCTISPSAPITSLSGAFRATETIFVPPASIPATVTDLSHLFANSAFEGTVGGWDVSNVQNMSYMFALTSYYGTVNSDNLSNWDVRKVTNMSLMFAGSVTDGSGYEMWQPVACTTMSSMFSGAANMSANLTSWASFLRSTVISSNFFTQGTFGCSGLTNPTIESPRSPFYTGISAPPESNYTRIASFTSVPNPIYQLGTTVYGTAGDSLFSINTSGNVYTVLATLTGTPLGAVTANVLSFDQILFGIVTGSPSALFFYGPTYGTVGTYLGMPNPYITYDAPGNLYTTDSTGTIYKVAATKSITSSTQTLTSIATSPYAIVGPLSVSNNILYGPDASGSLISVDLTTLTVTRSPQVPLLDTSSCLVDTAKAYFYDASGLSLNRYDIDSQVSTQLWDFSANPLKGTGPVGQILSDSIAQKLYGICSSGGPGLGNGARGAGTMWSYQLPSGPMTVLTSYVTGDLIRGSTPVSFAITTELGSASVITLGGDPVGAFRPRVNTYSLGSVNLPSYNVSCFNHGTKILRLVHGADTWSPVETLRRGDLIKTYKNGYRAITNIGKGILINDPNVWHSCMYQGQKEGYEPLIVTGGHAFLVDGMTQEEQKKQEIYWARDEFVVDDKVLMVAPVCKDFKPIMNNEVYTYYHFTVENDGDDDRRYGVWANGFLTETPSINQYKQQKYHSL